MTCPNCGKPKVFTGCRDSETGDWLPGVGICDRINNCGYEYTVKQFFEDNKNFRSVTDKRSRVSNKPLPPQKTTEYLPMDVVNQSFNYDYQNNFIDYLVINYGLKKTVEVINMYNIGTTKYYPGGTVFYQFDLNNNCRYGKVFLYDKSTCKRVKAKKIMPVHTILKLYDFNHCQVLFGLHLIKNSSHKVVQVVESEKTAVIAAIEYPNEIWLACGGLHLLNIEKLQPIKNKKIILHPDLMAYDKWKTKADIFIKAGFNIYVSDFLEKISTPEQRNQSWDLADYLLDSNQDENSKIKSILNIIDNNQLRLKKMIEFNPFVSNLIDRLDLKLQYLDDS